jgi:hypothetical protein
MRMPEEIKPVAECKTLQDLFSDPSRWAKGGYAFATEGIRKFKVWPFDKRAECFCLTGGFGRVYGDGTMMEQDKVRDKIFAELKGRSMVSWNDDPCRTFADIQALVKKLNV